MTLTNTQKKDLELIGKVLYQNIPYISRDNLLANVALQLSCDFPDLSESIYAMRRIFASSLYKKRLFNGLISIDSKISPLLEKLGITHLVEVREKSITSAIPKMMLKYYTGKSLLLSDFVAARITIDSSILPKEDLPKLCYSLENITSEILSNYGFNPASINSTVGHHASHCKDYIECPKSNGYQSLHALYESLIGGQMLPLEVQFRTQEMHETAETGPAAHLVYKDELYREIWQTMRLDRVVEKIYRLKVDSSGISKERIIMSLDHTHH